MRAYEGLTEGAGRAPVGSLKTLLMKQVGPQGVLEKPPLEPLSELGRELREKTCGKTFCQKVQ